MRARAPVVILALLVTGAPWALTVCEISCASHESHSAHAVTHSCHAVSTGRTGAPALSAGVHICGHDGEMPARAKAAPQAAPAADADALIVAAPVNHADVFGASLVPASPPGSRRSPIPLRI